MRGDSALLAEPRAEPGRYGRCMSGSGGLNANRTRHRNAMSRVRSVHYTRSGMRVRFPLLAGLLAALALTATAVEELWASTQYAEMGTRTVVAASAFVGTGGSPTLDCATEVVHAHPSCHAGGNPEAPHCPGMPLGVASSCVGVAALPVASLPQFEPSPEGSLSLGSADQTRDLLFASAFFRPPIA